jgi:putative glycerol-1-phosphate prenyltransferase
MLIDRIYNDFREGKKSLALLLDPDEYEKGEIDTLFSSGFDHVTYLFVGGSLLKDKNADSIIANLRKVSKKPVILFPGHASHISKNADAILFLSLLSGRNPEYLIGQQMISAPLIKKSGLEAIATAYLLIDGGKPTTVQYMSNTFPIPADKSDIAACTALAGKYMGFKLIYLDAGSGARIPISQEMIKAVKKETDLPLIVGGGIRSYEQMEQAYDAGADIVVIGNAIQNRELKLETLQSEKRS